MFLNHEFLSRFYSRTLILGFEFLNIGMIMDLNHFSCSYPLVLGYCLLDTLFGTHNYGNLHTDVDKDLDLEFGPW